MTHRSSSAYAPGTNGTSAVVPVPAGAAIGDIAVVGVYKESTAAVTPPAGFTAKATLTTSATARGALHVFWKRLTAADTGSYTFSWTGSAFRAAAAGLWSGRIATGDPFDGTVGTAESTVGVTTLNVSTSPATANGDAVGFWTNFNGGASFSAPTNYTQRQSVSGVIALETRDAVASGSTGNVTATATITDFMKAFLGVLAPAAGGTDATATPAAVGTTVAAPQATPSVSGGSTPASTSATVAVPLASVGIAAARTPSATAAIVSLPQATPQAAGNASVTPAPIAVVAALPRAGVNVAAGPAVLAAVVAAPQATPQTAGNATATPAAVSMVVGVPAGTARGAATAFPAVLAAVAALPQATPLAGGSATATPARIVTAVAVPPAVPSAAARVTPGVILTAVAVPRPAVGAAVGPASVGVLAALPGAVPVAVSSVVTQPAVIAALVGVPHASPFAEGVGMRGRLGELSPHLPGGIVAPGFGNSGGIGELSRHLPGGVVAPETFESGGTIR